MSVSEGNLGAWSGALGASDRREHPVRIGAVRAGRRHHQLAAASAALCFTRGRIRFVSPRGESGSPAQGHKFFYLGRDGAHFVEVFRTIGLVVAVRG